jgi:hypothetical protein
VCAGRSRWKYGTVTVEVADAEGVAEDDAQVLFRGPVVPGREQAPGYGACRIMTWQRGGGRELTVANYLAVGGVGADVRLAYAASVARSRPQQPSGGAARASTAAGNVPLRPSNGWRSSSLRNRRARGRVLHRRHEEPALAQEPRLGADLDELAVRTPRSGLRAPVGQPGQPSPLLNRAMYGAFVRSSYEVCGRRFSARRPPSPPALPAAG